MRRLIYHDLNNVFERTFDLWREIPDARLPITVKGDGQTIRSYQYGADMAVWLWTILIAGKRMGIYEVGSPNGYTISEVAQKVRCCFPGAIVNTLYQKVPGELKYVPCLLNSELNLKCEIELDDAIRRTIDWLR